MYFIESSNKSRTVRITSQRQKKTKRQRKCQRNILQGFSSWTSSHACSSVSFLCLLRLAPGVRGSFVLSSLVFIHSLQKKSSKRSFFFSTWMVPHSLIQKADVLDSTLEVNVIFENLFIYLFMYLFINCQLKNLSICLFSLKFVHNLHVSYPGNISIQGFTLASFFLLCIGFQLNREWLDTITFGTNPPKRKKGSSFPGPNCLHSLS